MNTLSDNPHMDKCASSEIEDMQIPETYDWRDQFPECVREVQSTDLTCMGATYAMAAISAAEDRICMHSKEQTKLSLSEFLDCDTTAKGCKGGDVAKVLNYGKRKGLLEQSCYPLERAGSCPEDHFELNSCRAEKMQYRVIDHCLAEKVEGVKREILKNGPVLAMVQPFTDFLTYSEGVYMRTQDSFKYAGYHIVKVIGWTNIKENDVWIIENTWGPDWGQKGFGKIASGTDSLIDQFAIGFAMMPIPQAMVETYRRQQEAQMQMQEFEGMSQNPDY